MDTLDELKLAPFNLDAEGLAWVKKTRDSLSTEDKVRQIYCPMGIYDDPDNARLLAQLKPGGLFRLMGPDLDAAWQATRIAIESSEVPLLIAGDLEGGAYCLPYNTAALNQIGVAACNDPALSRDIATVIAEEAVAMGYNWSFTPVLDINAKFRSAIVGTRSYGTKVATIIREAAVHIRVLQQHGVATTAKHWPGEGYDDRDQHLVTTVNPLNFDDWKQSYGHIYRSMIEQGVMAVMSVDGVNVLNGQTAGVDQSGYVFNGYQRYEVTGWRKSNLEVAAFEFVASPSSYAERTGRPANVGVIGVAVFKERVYQPPVSVAPPPYRYGANRGNGSAESRRSAATESAADSALASPAPSQSAPASAGAIGEMAKRAESQAMREKLGTGHGEREWSQVSHTSFDRAQSSPNETIRIRYDSRENLISMGVIQPPYQNRPWNRTPNAFPESLGFVPDPPRFWR